MARFGGTPAECVEKFPWHRVIRAGSPRSLLPFITPHFDEGIQQSVYSASFIEILMIQGITDRLPESALCYAANPPAEQCLPRTRVPRTWSVCHSLHLPCAPSAIRRGEDPPNLRSLRRWTKRGETWSPSAEAARAFIRCEVRPPRVTAPQLHTWSAWMPRMDISSLSN